MKYFLFILYLFSWISGPAVADVSTLDSLYRVLDAEIANAQYYVTQRQHRTDALREQLRLARTDRERLDRSLKLFEAYKAVRSDSAFFYIDKATEYARSIDDYNYEAQCLSSKAFLCSTLGLYTEALGVMRMIDPTRLDTETQGWYALAGQHIYGEMAYYTPIDNLREVYKRKADSYIDDILTKLPEDEEERLLRLEMKFYNEGKTKEALKVNDRRMSQVEASDRQVAIISFYRFLDLRLAGDSLSAQECLVRSAINDVRHGIMDQGAMWEVANILNSEGDARRGYRYITFTWECAQQFGTRMRSWQISPVLKAINANYNNDIERVNSRLTISVVLISILSALFLFAAIYVNRQRRLLAEAKRQLAGRNSELMDLNDQLQRTLTQLADSSRAKEMYIGRFFTLCSTYVDRLNKFRIKVSKSAKRRDIAELIRMTEEGDQKEKDLTELYEHFDSTFLKLYPDFVEKFWSLIKPEYRKEEEEGKLSTSLRIFALIRLGIEDSSKIAEFLHYSVNTIYNYRARMKNAAIEDRAHFEDRVKEIM